MLAFFGLLLTALMGVSALALDMGVATLAQKRLETAAELVALEHARGASATELQTLASALLAEPEPAASQRVHLGPIGPLEAGDPSYPGAFPSETDGVARLARRVPLLFGQGSMIAFAAPGNWLEILESRNDPANPNPGRLLPDGSIPPDELGLREQGLCVEGRGTVDLVPALALAVGGDAPFALPGRSPAAGLSILATEENPLWASRMATRETTCDAEEQGGAWFALSTTGGDACEANDQTCTVQIGEVRTPGGSELLQAGSDYAGRAASLAATPEPESPELHRMIVATVRDPATNAVVGFARLCLRQTDGTTAVSMRWNDTATPFTSFTSELHRSVGRSHWESVLRGADDACRHTDDTSLRCFAQSAVLAMPARPGGGT